MSAIARDAASFIAEVIFGAPAANAPWKTPGEASTLLLWVSSKHLRLYITLDNELRIDL